MSSRAIPLSDTRRLAGFVRRTTAVRIALAVAILLTAAACVLTAGRLEVGRSTLLGAGSSGVVVLDLSSSTESAPPLEIPGALRHLANSGGRSGLVLFSDVSYEALPLGATAEELRPFLRYFKVPPPPPPVARQVRNLQPPPRRRETPWSRSFRSGTRISAGLADARAMVLSESGRGRNVLLVSDLNDSLFDIESLERVLRSYRRDGIRLRIVALRPSPDNRAFFADRLGESAFVEREAFADGLAGQTARPTTGVLPTRLLVLIGVLAAALALNEVFCARLRWSAA